MEGRGRRRTVTASSPVKERGEGEVGPTNRKVVVCGLFFDSGEEGYVPLCRYREYRKRADRIRVKFLRCERWKATVMAEFDKFEDFKETVGWRTGG